MNLIFSSIAIVLLAGLLFLIIFKAKRFDQRFYHIEKPNYPLPPETNSLMISMDKFTDKNNPMNNPASAEKIARDLDELVKQGKSPKVD